MSKQLMIPVADTRLYAVDTPGGTPPLLFLSGGFGTARNWARLIHRLDGKYRTVRFDARARAGRQPGAHRRRLSNRVLDEAGKQKVRVQFRRLGWIMRILAALGRSARMSAAESADVVILSKAPDTVVAAIDEVIPRVFLSRRLPGARAN